MNNVLCDFWINKMNREIVPCFFPTFSDMSSNSIGSSYSLNVRTVLLKVANRMVLNVQNFTKLFFQTISIVICLFHFMLEKNVVYE